MRSRDFPPLGTSSWTVCAHTYILIAVFLRWEACACWPDCDGSWHWLARDTMFPFSMVGHGVVERFVYLRLNSSRMRGKQFISIFHFHLSFFGRSVFICTARRKRRYFWVVLTFWSFKFASICFGFIRSLVKSGRGGVDWLLVLMVSDFSGCWMVCVGFLNDVTFFTNIVHIMKSIHYQCLSCLVEHVSLETLVKIFKMLHLCKKKNFLIYK